MALELLAGPFDIVDRARGAAVGSTVSGTPIWFDSAGLLLPIASEGVYLVQLDGAAYRIADDEHLDYGLALQGDAADPLARSRTYAVSKTLGAAAGEWDLDPVTRHRAGRVAPTHVLTSHNYARLHDRYLRPIGGRIEARPLDLSADFASECSFAGLSDASFLSWSMNAAEIVIGANSGQFVRYDWLRRAQVGALGTIGMSCSGLWCSARHGVLLSLHRTETGQALRVWAGTVQPASLSAPAATPTAGRRMTVTTRVLGAHGEPCPGEVVAWRLVGPGQLVLAATSTDASGWARTFVDLPLDASGSFEIHAELSF